MKQLLAVAFLAALTTAAPAQNRWKTYACVISVMGKQAFYKGDFRSWTNCMAYCSYNANIRGLGGQIKVRYNCPPERW